MESYEDTYGKKSKRKKPKLTSDGIEGMLAAAAKKTAAYSAPKDTQEASLQDDGRNFMKARPPHLAHNLRARAAAQGLRRQRQHASASTPAPARQRQHASASRAQRCRGRFADRRARCTRTPSS